MGSLPCRWRSVGLAVDCRRIACGKASIQFRPHRNGKRKPRLAILVTKEPHCLDRLVRDVRTGRIGAEIVLVASNRPDLRDHVTDQLGLPFLHVDDRDKPAHEAALLAELDRAEADYVVLARYMRILSPNFVWRYPHRVVNIHPSLLPSFPGAAAYRQAHRAGVRVAGVTAHFVTMNLDEGPIIVQRSFQVTPHATVHDLAQRGRGLEAEALSEAVSLLVEGRLDVHWGRVEIRPRRA
jgi:formyltetrahydrofolate deformylase